MTTQTALHTIASKSAKYPNGRETAKIPGMKIKPVASNATVRVYPVPVDFC